MNQIIIKKIIPQGFCYGVVCALKLINELLATNNYPKPIYMLGKLVHNDHIIKGYQAKGIIILDQLPNDLNQGTIIVTAHGLDFKSKQKIINQGLHLIDATCSEVLKIQNLISEKINKGYQIIYYGMKNHSECRAIMGLSPKICLISNKEDISSLDFFKENEEKRLFFSNQTTMFYDEVETIKAILSEKYSNLEIQNDICKASKQRQEALIKQASDCDLCLVVGDKKSNNTNKLKDICLTVLNKPTVLIEDFLDIKKVNLAGIKKIAITAGASTPNKLVDEIIKVLNDPNYQSQLTDIDYLSL